MRSVPMTLTFGGSLFALATVATLSPRPGSSAPPGGISLLQTLSEWKYPGSDLLDGATMSDGGIPPLQAVKCTAIMTTPDPIEKVVAFYVEKLENDAAKTISSQNDSRGRPVTLRVIVVNRVDSSTTLVISRAEGEKETHIAWSHYIRLAAPAEQAKVADDRMRFSLSIYSGREDPTWEASDEEAKKFSAKFEALKGRDAVEPLDPVLGYRGFLVDGFRSYARIWVWKGTVEATREGKTFQWDDEGRTLEKYLLESSKAHVNDREYKMAASEVEKK